MKLSNLVKLCDLSDEKLKELFDSDENFAWSVRNYATSCEIHYLMDVMNEFAKSKADVEWDFGVYTSIVFRVKRTPESISGFLDGLKEIQEAFCFLPDSDNAVIQKMETQLEKYYSDEEDDLAWDHLVSTVYDLETRIYGQMREQQKWLENDSNIKNEYISQFVECIGDNVYFDGETNSLYELERIRQHCY